VNRQRLYRCRHDQRISGVASGVAEFFDLDVSIVRLLWVLSIFFGGLGLLLYIVMAIVVPLEPENQTDFEGDPGVPPGDASAPMPVAPGHRHVGRRQGHSGNGFGMTLFGLALILFGALALIDVVLPAWSTDGRFLWPAFILGLGVLLVVTAVRRRPTEQ
jgi:phage shock protein PspC (stress-responsive transcriptional regulator)